MISPRKSPCIIISNALISITIIPPHASKIRPPPKALVLPPRFEPFVRIKASVIAVCQTPGSLYACGVVSGGCCVAGECIAWSVVMGSSGGSVLHGEMCVQGKRGIPVKCIVDKCM